MAAIDASASVALSHLEPLRVLPERRLPPDSWLPGAHAGPGGEMPRGGERAHVDADLGDQHLGGALLDAGDRHQQVPSGFCSCRRAALRVAPGHHPLLVQSVTRRQRPRARSPPKGSSTAGQPRPSRATPRADNCDPCLTPGAVGGNNRRADRRRLCSPRVHAPPGRHGECSTHLSLRRPLVGIAVERTRRERRVAAASEPRNTDP